MYNNEKYIGCNIHIYICIYIVYMYCMLNTLCNIYIHIVYVHKYSMIYALCIIHLYDIYIYYIYVYHVYKYYIIYMYPITCLLPLECPGGRVERSSSGWRHGPLGNPSRKIGIC